MLTRSWLSDLQVALAGFYQRAPQAANRMAPIQQVVKAELESRFSSLGEALEVRLERPVRGKHRTKTWDQLFDVLVGQVRARNPLIDFRMGGARV